MVYTSGALDTIGWLLASNGAVLDSSDDHDLTGGDHNFSLGASLGPGIFYVAVRANQDAAGEYTLYAETFSDAAGNLGTTAVLPPGVGSNGLIATGGDFDWYKPDMTGAADVWLYTSGALDTRGFLLDSGGNVLEDNNDSDLSDGIRNFFIGEHLDAGVYYIAVTSYGTDTGPYKLHAELKTDLGDSTSTAADLALDTPQTGVIGPAGDIDYFKLDLSGSADIVIYTSGGLDTVGELRDGNDGIIAADDDGDISGGSGNFSVWSMLNAGTYHIKVAGYDGATGPYQLHAEAVSDPAGDTGTTAAIALESNQVGVLNPRPEGDDDVDWFKLDLTGEDASTDVIIQTNGPVDTVGRLLDSDGAELADNDDGGFGRNFLIGANLGPGVYYVEVAGYAGSTGPYRVEALPLDDHGDTPGTASGLPLGSGGRDGVIGPAGDSDLFGFRVPSATEIWLYTAGDVDTQGRLYRYDGSLELLDFNDDGGRGVNFFIQRTLDPGIYFIEVMGWEDETGYYGIYNRIPDAPGSSASAAQRVGLGQIGSGKIDEPGDADYFRLDLVERTNLFLYTSGVQGLPTEGQVLDHNGQELDVSIFPWSRGFFVEDDLGPGTYYVKVTDPAASLSAFPRSGLAYLLVSFDDLDYTKFVDKCTAQTMGLNDPIIADSLYACQWHLDNDQAVGEDLNVEAVWAGDANSNLDGVKGAGVNVAVVDDGIDIHHPDLSGNVKSEFNHDYTGNDSVYTPLEHHGTAVAGIIAAQENNLGVRGVAPQADIYGYNLLVDSTDFNSADAMARRRVETAVSNNSWGPLDGAGLGSTTRFWEEAVKTGIEEGYDGKGTMYVFAGGNGHQRADDSNLDEYVNYYGVTAVCAVNDRGTRSNYSEKGANLWVCGPSSDSRYGYRGIVTTENSNRYQDRFGGTSAAAPAVSGVAALLRSANPDLTWRDLKLILAASARKNDPANPGWEESARKYLADSGTDTYQFNHEYGFGMVDAEAAVALARDWTNVPALTSVTVEYTGTDGTIPETSVGATTSLSLTTGIRFVEYVEVRATFQHESFRDLTIDLVSPNGAVSHLAVVPAPEIGYDREEDPVPLDGEIRLGSSRHLGEDPNGVWRLRVADLVADEIGTLDSFTITVYGHEHNPGLPIISSVIPGQESLTVEWSAPRFTVGPGITNYDLRYIRSNADETVDANWTVVRNVWTAGSGALQHIASRLAGGNQYDLQIRAVNSAGRGQWSKTAIGTPALAITSACVTGAAVPDAANNSGLSSDCAALLAARDALAGSAVLDWSGDTPIGGWEGVTVSGAPMRVTKLDLDSKGMTGTIPAELGSLTGLTVLSLVENDLTGAIPVELGNLTNLTGLHLGGNLLTGCIPGSLRDAVDYYLAQFDPFFCDVRLSGLGITPGTLAPEFDPGFAHYYTVEVSVPQVTITPVNDHNGTFRFRLNGDFVDDADDGLPGHQIDLEPGTSKITVEVTSRDGAETGAYVIMATLLTAPGAVTGLTAMAVDGDAQVNLSWTAPANTGGAPITGYEIESSDDGNYPWEEVYTTTGEATTYTDDGADNDGPSFEAGTTRYYRVSAVNSVGTGPAPNLALATTDTCLELLGPLTAPVTRHGAWASGCQSEARSGSHARYYTFTLDRATQVEMNLTSAVDTYLFLRRGGKTGTVVADNDNVRSRNFNSSINRMLAAGTYTVEATTIYPRTRDFTLSVRPLECMEELGMLTGSVDRSNSLWVDTCASTQREGSYARSYTFTLAEETHVGINLTSAQNTYLYLTGTTTNGVSVDMSNDDAPNQRTRNSGIEGDFEAGTYTIEATTYFPGQTGTFHLSIGYFGRPR